MPLNAGVWTTLDNVKIHLGLLTSDSSQDALLTNMINASQRICEQYLHHPILQASYTEYYDGDGTGKLILRKWPIISVTSIHIDIDREFDSDDLADPTNYYVDSENGIIEFYRAFAAGPAWFDEGIKNIKVVYSAGFASIPDDLIEAADEHVAWMFRRANTEGTTQQSLGGKSEVYDDRKIPDWLKLKLLPYRDRTL